MSMKNTRAKLDISAILAAAGDLSDGQRAKAEFDTLWGNGTGSNQAESMYYDVRSLAASATENADLQTVTDANGVAIALVDVRMFLVQCPSTNTAGIKFYPGASNGWTALNASSGATDDPETTIMPGATYLVHAPVDASYAVSASNKVLTFENLSGSDANTYTILAIGVKS